MAARFLSLLAGILFAGLGWAILGPGAIAGVEPPSIQLGMFEGHRSFIGWGAAALGIVALLSSVLPRGGGGGGGKRRAAPRIDFDAEPAPSAADGEPVGGGPTASPPPRLETVADETFADLRERLRTLVREEQWPTAAALARRLPTSATNDEERLLAARDLGDFTRAQGAGEEAAEAYEMALASARGLAAEAPTDPVRLAMLAGVLTGVGDSAQDEGRLEAAVEAYEEALEIRRQLAREDTSTEARRALSLALERLGDAREDRGHRVRAHDLYRESLEIAGQLAAADPQKYGEDLQVTRRRLGELEARLAAV